MSGSGDRNVKAVNRMVFLISTLVSGMVAGAFIWGVLFVMNLGISAIWDRIPVYLGSFYPVIVCLIGGLVIGLFTRRFGDYPETLPEVMAKVRSNGRYEYDKIGVMSAGAVLPLVFGGSVGPEAGLTGVIAALCTWVSDRFKRFGNDIRCLTEAGTYATLSVIFAAPLFGAAGITEDGRRNAGNEATMPMRILTYAFAAGGAFSALLLLSGAVGSGMSMPYYGDIGYGRDEFLWLIPIAAVGAVAGWMFCVLDGVFHRVSSRFDDGKIVKPVVAGLVLGVCGFLLPLTMFSGEAQCEELDGLWTTFAPATLLLIGFVKIAVTAMCVNMGWRGGHFFPVIFAGISIGYGMSMLVGADPVFSVCAATAAVVGGVLRKPLLTVLLLFLCFPIHSVVVLAVAAIVGSLIPVPKSLARESVRSGAGLEDRFFVPRFFLTAETWETECARYRIS